MKLSNNVQQLSPSLTLKISAKAKAMKKDGIPVIDFSVGEPDFFTPDNVKVAGIQAITENFTRYTQSDGIPELKQAIINRLKIDDNLDYTAKEIIVSTGAKTSIYLALAATVDPGDEVIVPAPYWVSYPEQVKLLGAAPIFVAMKESDNFLLTADSLKKAITSRTKAILLNNPSNPTGSAYTEAQLKPVLEVAHRHGLFVIADEIYSKITYPGYQFKRVVTVLPEIRNNTVIIDGASKAYSMTGWRIGYTAGPEEIIAAMKRIQDHLTSNPVSISQKAALEAFQGDQSFLENRNREFQTRRDYLLQEFRSIPGFKTNVPQGAFYLFPNVSALYKKSFKGKPITSSLELCDYLLEQAHVALVPGEGFGSPDNIRISFATSMDNIREGVKRIAKAVAALD
ncbi:MAG: pyridoxal phosphate-dependent aminotransferase [bacterium]